MGRRFVVGAVAFVVLLAGFPATPASAQFVDVRGNEYYADAVDWMHEVGLTTGVGGTNRYDPHGLVTRAQMVTFLWRLQGEPKGHGAHGFADIPGGTYYEHAVRWAKATGLTTGVGGTNRFAPNDPVTRGQMAAFLWRIAGNVGSSFNHGFADVPHNAYFATAVRWLRQHGITTGVAPATYGPHQPVTRGQMAAFIYRLVTSPRAWDKGVPWVFGPGTYLVGSEIPAGTYRIRGGTSFCYWERKSGFGGSLGEIIQNGLSDAPMIVTIHASDAGFESGNGCGPWSSNLSRVTSSPTASFGPGQYFVGTDIAPGTWRSSAGSGCYWERLAGFAGSLEEINANSFSNSRATVTILPSDLGFTAGSGCGTWQKIG